MNNKRVVTGLKPTGELHIGNYFASLKQLKNLQNEYDEIYLFEADLHSLTTLNDANNFDKDKLKDNSIKIAKAYLSIGLDLNKVILYRQSLFPQVTELAWIFMCLLNEDYLKIGHAYKDALNNSPQKYAPLGVLLYPALMAADIVLANGLIVPVGKDQVQHIEITREFVRKYNNVAGSKVLNSPEEKIIDIEEIKGIDGRKMSKSYDNHIPIFAEKEFIIDRIKKIKTDSIEAGEPINEKKCLVCHYLKLLMKKDDYISIKSKCSSGSITYQELKEILTKEFFNYFGEYREKYEKLNCNTKIQKILNKNYKKLENEFNERLDLIKSNIGLNIREKERGFFN